MPDLAQSLAENLLTDVKYRFASLVRLYLQLPKFYLNDLSWKTRSVRIDSVSGNHLLVLSLASGLELAS